MNSNTLHSKELERIQYNNAIDQAVQDAITDMVESDDGLNVIVNKERILDNFYNSLYANLGTMENVENQDWLKMYVPVFLVTDVDGFYIYRGFDQDNHLYRDWTEKMPYSYKYGDYIFSFTINKIVKVLDLTSSSVYEGDYRDIAFLPELASIPFLHDAASFDTIRRTTITNSIMRGMSESINIHNKLAKTYGFSYDFYIPAISNDDWDRTVDDIGILVLFQGYPYHSAADKYFNCYEFGGSRTVKKEHYYITNEITQKYYHREDCIKFHNPSFKDSLNTPYDSKKECSLKGAYPCPVCKP